MNLATVLPVSDELLSDAPGIQGYINSGYAVLDEMLAAFAISTARRNAADVALN